MLPVLLHPRSRGYIRLRSANPLEPPLINPRYLTHPRDVHVLLEGKHGDETEKLQQQEERETREEEEERQEKKKKDKRSRRGRRDG